MERLLKPGNWLWLWRCLILAIAVGYVAAETREVVEQEQLAEITQFALFFLLANFQLNIARYYQSAKKETLAQLYKSCSVLMFFACLLAVADAAMDSVIAATSRGALGVGALFSSTAFGADWLINLAMVVLAVMSLDRCVCLLLSQDLSLSHKEVGPMR